MLTKADDYPIHQTPDPIAYAGTDRNFYDRYFFNGYSHDGEHFFAAAMGIYPHLNIMDASFCVVHAGVQHNLRASKVMHSERIDTNVAPISVQVVEPLQVLRVVVDENDHGISADLTYTARTLPIEEPRFTHRIGPRTMMDYTRLTQNGTWQGWYQVDGIRIEVTPDKFWGTRDRSWGIRGVGAPDSQPVSPPPEPQFYWLWAPLNFDDRISLYHLNADGDGNAWNTNAVLCGLGDAAPEEMGRCASDIGFKKGTRHAQSAMINLETKQGDQVSIKLTPHWNFYMSGLGYMHPEWGHGMFRGEHMVGYDTIDLAKTDETEMLRLHVQAFVSAELILPGGEVKNGSGVLEQLVLGRYDPSGLTGLLDGAG